MATIRDTVDLIDSYLNVGYKLTESIQHIASVRMPHRRFKGEELRELAGIANLSTLYMAEKEGRLPPPDVDANNRRLGATVDQLLKIQTYFDTQPWRSEDEDAVVLSFTNFKGGCWKTVTSWYAGAYYANKGLRVLLVDLDPQASLTLNCGLLPDVETSHEVSLGPYVLQEEGFPVDRVASVVRDTYLHTMKIIPASLELAGTEYVIANDMLKSRLRGDQGGMVNCFSRVKLAIEHLKPAFDIIILDGTPSLGLLPMNIIFASDAVIVPTPTEITDFCSTLCFCELYKEQADVVRTHLGEKFTMPSMAFLATRFSPSEKSATLGSEFVLKQIRETFGSACLKAVIKKHESVVSNLSLLRRTVFDINPGDGGISRDQRKKAMVNFAAVFDEILENIVYPYWPSKKTLLEERGIY